MSRQSYCERDATLTALRDKVKLVSSNSYEVLMAIIINLEKALEGSPKDIEIQNALERVYRLNAYISEILK